MKNAYHSICFGGGRFLVICLTAMILVLTFVNTVSARYRVSHYSRLDLALDTPGPDQIYDFKFDRCVALRGEMATQLNTHG